jgi:hypothetical protein
MAATVPDVHPVEVTVAKADRVVLRSAGRRPGGLARKLNSGLYALLPAASSSTQPSSTHSPSCAASASPSDSSPASSDTPAEGSPAAEITETQRKADHVFIALLTRFTLENRQVSHKAGSNYAPHLFAEESEARIAKVGKAVLADSMRRLLKEQRIQVFTEGTGHKQRHTLVVS